MDPYRQQYPPYPGQQLPQQRPPPHLQHGGPPPPGSHYGPPQGPPPMYQGGPPPHMQLGPPPPHFQGHGGPLPPPGQHYPPHQGLQGSAPGGPYGAIPPQNGGPPPHGYPPHHNHPSHQQHHHRMQRPPYGGPPGSLPPPGGPPPPGIGGYMGADRGGDRGGLPPPPSLRDERFDSRGAPPSGMLGPGIGHGGVPPSAFVVGGALPEKMSTLFVGSIAPGINNIAMEKLLKTTGNLVKWKRVQDPTTQQWKAFGFAEYADADSLLRTLRVLGQDGQQPKGEKPVGLELTAMDGSGVTKALLVKADEKTRQFLDQYEESRPRTIHDTEKDKVALTNANKIIQKMKDGTLDISKHETEDKEDGAMEDVTSNSATTNKKSTEDKDSTEPEVSDEQKELIARELNFFRERAALKEKERREEEEKAERHRGRHSHQHPEKDRIPGRERAWGSNSALGTRLQEFVPASGSNHIEVGTGSSGVTATASASGATGGTAAADDKAVDSEEEERARHDRREREQEHSFKERERRWEQREVERMRLYEKNNARDEDHIAERHAAKGAMAHKFAQWNDDVEKDRRHEEYYRDRSRWWQRRQAFLQKEERYDAQDREEERVELEREVAKKAQEEAAAAAAVAASTLTTDTDGDLEMKDASQTVDSVIASTTVPDSSISIAASSSSPSIPDASILPNQPTNIKLSLSTASNAGPGTPNSGSGPGSASGFVAANEFGQDEDDEKRETKKRRVLVPLKYSDDESDGIKTTHDASVVAANGGAQPVNQKEKERQELEIRRLIQSIPSDAQELWNWDMKWQYMSESILTDKIRPFASKKVVELLGVQEDELTDFVVEHIREKKAPQDLVDELRNALDDDADVLVMKVWRMLIFETETESSKARQVSSLSK